MSNEADQLTDMGNQFDERDRADMERLTAGHDAALNELIECHAAKLFNYLIRCLKNEEDAADAGQEAFVRVYQHRAKFDASQKFTTWLYAIATNLVKDHYRYRTRHPQISLDTEHDQTDGDLGTRLAHPDSTPRDSLETTERLAAIRKSVAALPEELRAPLILAEYEETPHAEIAKILGCSLKAVETGIYRAREQLRASLNDLLLKEG